MILKKMMVTIAALGLALAPTSASALPDAEPAGEEVGGQAQFEQGFAAHWIVIGVVALAVLFLVVLDDDEDPVSP